MSEYVEEYKGYKLKIWTEVCPETNRLLYGGEYQIEELNRIWHFKTETTLRALFYEAVEKKIMNWQTKEIQNWLNGVGILNSQREDVTKLQELVEYSLLVRGNLDCTDRIKNLAVMLLLKHIQWEQLVYNPDAWNDYEYKEDVS